LTGGIGSGKSTATSFLVACGASLVDTDAIAHRLTAAGGEAMTAVRSAFGDGVIALDGSLDRAAMRERAFGNSHARRRLEAILHPLISQHAGREAALAHAAPAIVFDVPLLAESAHWRSRVDRVVVIDCRPETQLERVCSRPGWTREAAERVIMLQASRAARRAVADAVIFNDGISLDALQRDIETLWDLWSLPRQAPVEQ
jgi:dephospho-CoA kinase